MPPGLELAAALTSVDLSTIPNQKMIDLLQAAWREKQRTDAFFYAVMAETARCTAVREGSDPGHVGRSALARPFANTEIGAALTRTPSQVQRELDWVMVLDARLPMVQAAFSAGLIDQFKAREFAVYLAELTDAQIEQICTDLLPGAPKWTTGQLSHHLRQAVLEVDPGFTRRRYAKAFGERKVTGYLTDNGTATLSVHGLPPAEMAAACDRLASLAESIRTAGHSGPLRQIEADLATRLIDGTFTGMDRRQIIAAMLAEYAAAECGAECGAEGPPAERPTEDAAPASEPRQGVEVCIGLTTILGLDDHPAVLPGWGPIFAEHGRGLAGRQLAAEWRFAVTDEDGALVLAGVTRHRPFPARTDCAGGIVELEVSVAELAELAACTDLPGQWTTLIADIVSQHAARDQSDIDAHPDDRFPRARLRQHTQARDGTCVGPGCRRPATKSDLDHTHSREDGGQTVSANLGPLCDLHHAMKTFGGWSLTQPEPGLFRWRSPLGRIYETRGARAAQVHREPPPPERAVELDDLPP